MLSTFEFLFSWLPEPFETIALCLVGFAVSLCAVYLLMTAIRFVRGN